MSTTDRIELVTGADAVILRAAKNILTDAQDTARDLALSSGAVGNYPAYQLGKVVGHAGHAAEALGTVLIWMDILNPSNDDDADRITGAVVIDGDTFTDYPALAAAPVAAVPCKIDGCDNAALTTSGPYTKLCAEHRAESSAALKWRRKATRKGGAR